MHVACTDRDHTGKRAMLVKRTSPYIRVREVRGQVPGTTRNRHAPPGLELHKCARVSSAAGKNSAKQDATGWRHTSPLDLKSGGGAESEKESDS